MREGEGPTLKHAGRKAEIKAQRDNTEILEGCGSNLSKRTIYQKHLSVNK